MKFKSKGKKRIVRRIIAIIVLPLLCLVAVFANSFIPQDLADVYCSKVFPIISIPLQSINMYFQHSMTENAVVCLGPLLVVGIIVWIVVLIKRALSHGALEYLYRSFRNVLALVLIGAVLFQAMHGINYKRTHVVDELDLTDEELTYEDYCVALEWAYAGLIEARSQLGEDYNGVAHMTESFENSASYANSLLNAFCLEYDIPLSENYVRAKPVSMSHYWSYTYIVGMYDPFLAEVNVNTDYEDITGFPLTVCHELCHAKGYASETDCNTLAALACCYSERADFRYAGFYEVFWSLYGVALVSAKKLDKALPRYLETDAMIPVFRDAQAESLYWEQIDYEVDEIKKKLGIDITEVSTATNDAFLKTNGETGVESYVVPDSTYVRFYLTYVGG
ncbi:MAG: DUF3810 domain-containing protein [Saccharofermentans sp.]|nr:DUF3810 domain-containing protein [Saccharofermentans sp.]